MTERDPRSTYRRTEQGRRRAIVVHPYLKSDERFQLRTVGARLEEAVGLAQAIDLEVVESLPAPMSEVRPATLIGKGKVDEILAVCETTEVELVICDGQLSPVQQRNLEKAWNVKVLDRTGLILEIFGERARTAEGRLQVELAHLSYQKGRLVRSWTLSHSLLINNNFKIIIKIFFKNI